MKAMRLLGRRGSYIIIKAESFSSSIHTHQMKFTKPLILVAFLLLQSAYAFAANWVLVAESADSQFYIDTASMIRTGNKVQCWVSSNYNEPQKEIFAIDYEKDKYSSNLYFTEYDCYNRTSRVLELTEYSEKDRRGSVVRNHSFTLSTPSRIRPESVDEALLVFVCKQSKNK